MKIFYQNSTPNSPIPMAKVTKVVVQTFFKCKSLVCEHGYQWFQQCTKNELVNHVANLIEFGG